MSLRVRETLATFVRLLACAAAVCFVARDGTRSPCLTCAVVAIELAGHVVPRCRFPIVSSFCVTCFLFFGVILYRVLASYLSRVSGICTTSYALLPHNSGDFFVFRIRSTQVFQLMTALFNQLLTRLRLKPLSLHVEAQTSSEAPKWCLLLSAKWFLPVDI